MAEQKTSLTKKVVAGSAAGLNAAALIFLYTNFVPRTEYNRLLQQHDKLVDESASLKLQAQQLKDRQEFFHGHWDSRWVTNTP